MSESLRAVIYGNATSESCHITDCATDQGVYVSMRMRLMCEIRRAGKAFVDQRLEVRLPTCLSPSVLPLLLTAHLH